MFVKRKFWKDLPAIDIRQKEVKGFFGCTKLVPRSKKEHRQVKYELMKQYPDRYFIDDLHEINSVDPLGWIDVIETMDAFMEMYDLSAMSKEY